MLAGSTTATFSFHLTLLLVEIHVGWPNLL